MSSYAKDWKAFPGLLNCCLFLSFSIFLASCLASANLTTPEQFTTSAYTQVAASSLLNCSAHCPRGAKIREVAQREWLVEEI